MEPPVPPPEPTVVPRPAGERLLEGRVAIVTGGGAGIGAGITRALAAHGARVVVAEIDRARLDTVLGQVAADAGSPEPLGLAVDVRDPMEVEQLRQHTLEWGGGRIDVLVNNVGDYRPNGPFVHTTPDDWDALHAVNLRHVLLCTRAVLPTMIAQRSGSIINLSSVEGLRGIPNNAVYSAYKAGVLNFTASLAAEVGNNGVRVNAIAPDLTDTPQTPMWAMTPDEYAPNVPKWVPVGRFGRPDDHGDVAVFLASEQSRFVTGQTIKVDGGTLAAPGWYRRNEVRFTNMPRDP